jgi:hypothetical protein
MSLEQRHYRERRIGANEPLLRWVVAAGIASVAIVGLLTLIVALLLYLPLPPSLEMAVAIGLVVGACAYAWMLATALGSRDAISASRQSRPGRTARD